MDNLSPNLFFYVPTLFHFLVSKLKKAQAQQPTNQEQWSPSPNKQILKKKEMSYPIMPPSLDHDSKEEGSQSVI